MHKIYFQLLTTGVHLLLIENGKKIVLSDKAQVTLENSNIQWERPSFRIALGFGNSFNMKEHEVTNITWKKDLFHKLIA